VRCSRRRMPHINGVFPFLHGCLLIRGGPPLPEPGWSLRETGSGMFFLGFFARSFVGRSRFDSFFGFVRFLPVEGDPSVVDRRLLGVWLSPSST